MLLKLRDNIARNDITSVFNDLENAHRKIQFSLLLLVFLLYPFSIKLSNAAILSLSAHWLFWLIQRPNDFTFKSRSMWLLILLYLTTAVSVLYSENLHVAIYALDKKISLLIFGLILGTSPPLTRRHRDTLLTSAVLIIFVALLYCLAYATFQVKIIGTEAFFWKNLTVPLGGFHPTYLSLYINFLIAWLAAYFYQERTRLTPATRILFFFFIGFFYICLVLLSSKIHIVFGLLLPLFWAGLHLTMKRLVIVAPFFLFILMLAGLIIKNTKAWDRFQHIQTFSYELDAPVATFNEFTIRLAIIECSFQVLKDNFLLGVGAGDVDQELDKVYRKEDYKFGFLDQQNPHNQYLSQWLATGLPGLVVLLLILIVLFRKFAKVRAFDLFIMLILFSCTFTFESVLERQKGIVLFSLLASLYLFSNETSSIHRKTTEQDKRA